MKNFSKFSILDVETEVKLLEARRRVLELERENAALKAKRTINDAEHLEARVIERTQEVEELKAKNKDLEHESRIDSI